MAHDNPWHFLGDLTHEKVLYGAYKDSVFHTDSTVWRFVRYSLGTVLDQFEQAEDIAEHIYHKRAVALQRFHAHEEAVQNYRNNDFIRRSAEISQNTWFKRVWVLQEVHSNPVVHVRHGAKQVSWLAFNSLYMASYDINTRFVQQSIFSRDWRMLETVWETIKRGVVPSLWMKIGLLADDSKKNFEICKLLERTSSDFEATDPRDKLFGIYHLATDIDSSTFRPDYTKSLGETYQSFTEWLILQHGHLEVLSFVRNASPDKLAGLPSWVPDFRFRIQGREWRLAEMCRNDGSVVPTLTAANKMFDGRNLCLRGRHVVTVKSVVSLNDFRLAGMKDCNEWNSIGIDKIWVMLFLTQDIMRKKSKPGVYIATEDAVNEKFSLMTFLQTMLVTELDEPAGIDDESFIANDSSRLRDLIRLWGELDRDFRSLDDCPRDIMQYKQLHDRLIGPNAAVIATHDSSINYMVLNGRSFFFSVDGRLGLCPEGTRRGDSVVMLDGGSTPFVIREDPKGYGTMREWLTHGKTWEFIGECYLQGAMAVAGCRNWGWHDPLWEDYELDSYKGPRVMDDGGIVVGSYRERVFRFW